MTYLPTERLTKPMSSWTDHMRGFPGGVRHQSSNSHLAQFPRSYLIIFTAFPIRSFCGRIPDSISASVTSCSFSFMFLVPYIQLIMLGMSVRWSTKDDHPPSLSDRITSYSQSDTPLSFFLFPFFLPFPRASDPTSS